jgi:Flp pilus assembly protein TadD
MVKGVDRMNGQNSASNETPEMISLMGYSLATQSGQLKEGIALCEKALSLSPNRPEHYLNLGRIYLLANKRERAINIFRTGLRVRKDSRIIHELKNLGIRKPPVLESLPRDHMINIIAGKMLTLLNLR